MFCSNWNVRLVVNTQSMFQNARIFNQNLCSWGSRIANATIASNMFLGTSCPFPFMDPDFSYSPGGPFCHDCCCRPTLPSVMEGPFEVSVIPAAASNLPDGRIMAWSGAGRYQFDGTGVGTYYSLFNPVTRNSTLRSVFGKRRHHAFITDEG
jgi:Mycoplasma protein of unknown function, DUF285